MKRILLMALLTLGLPLTALANPVDFTNEGGTLSGSSAGLNLSGSTLISVNGLNGMALVTGNLGTMTFSTAGLSFGDLQQGATFMAGGAFVITGNGTNGVVNGTIFSGTFVGPLTWSLLTGADGMHYYTLSGVVTGTWYTGVTVNGAVETLTLPTGTGFFDGSVTLGSGNTVMTLTSVPEPGTLGLVGTGIISFAVFRIKSCARLMGNDRQRGINRC